MCYLCNATHNHDYDQWLIEIIFNVMESDSEDLLVAMAGLDSHTPLLLFILPFLSWVSQSAAVCGGMRWCAEAVQYGDVTIRRSGMTLWWPRGE